MMPPPRRYLILGACSVLVPLLVGRAAPGEETPPKLRVVSVRKVFDDGNHNAFTDLCRFKGKYYLTFRSCPDGHGVFPTSKIVVLSSDDADKWHEVHTFSVPLRDTRDPHFLVFRDQLFIYSGCWFCPTPSHPQEFNEHLGYGVWTTDGKTWNGPRMLEGTYGHYIWRAGAYGDKAYLCARRKRELLPTKTRAERDELVQSAIFESDDGLVWKYRGMFQDDYGNETAFLFEDDGSILAIARGSGGQKAQVCRAKPPYEKFSRVELDRHLGGPLVAKWGSRYLVAGRGYPSRGYSTAVYWLIGEELHPIAKLPSGGDTSYPGFVQLSDKRGLLSYYSSHEGSGDGHAPASIYLAVMEIE